MAQKLIPNYCKC